MVSVFQ